MTAAYVRGGAPNPREGPHSAFDLTSGTSDEKIAYRRLPLLQHDLQLAHRQTRPPASISSARLNTTSLDTQTVR